MLTIGAEHIFRTGIFAWTIDDDCRLTHVHHTLLNVRRAFGAPAIEKCVVSACRPAIIITITVNNFFNTGKCLVKRITSSGIVWL